MPIRKESNTHSARDPNFGAASHLASRSLFVVVHPILLATECSRQLCTSRNPHHPSPAFGAKALDPQILCPTAFPGARILVS